MNPDQYVALWGSLPPATDRSPTTGAHAVDRTGSAVEMLAAVDPFLLSKLPSSWRDRVRADLDHLGVLVERLKYAVKP